MNTIRLIIAFLLGACTVLGFIALWIIWDAYQNLPDHEDHQ